MTSLNPTRSLPRSAASRAFVVPGGALMQRGGRFGIGFGMHRANHGVEHATRPDEAGVS